MRRPLLLALVAFALPLQAEADLLVSQHGVLLASDYLLSDTGIFIRNAEIGADYPPAEFLAMYPASHRSMLADSSRLDAAREAILYLGAGQRFVWNPQGKFRFWSDDFAQRCVKIGLLTSTLLAYSQAEAANRALGNSSLFVNAESARIRFEKRRGIYYGTLGLTAVYFVAQAIMAGYWFGRNSDGVDLLHNEIPLTTVEYLDRFPPRKSGASLNTRWSFRF